MTTGKILTKAMTKADAAEVFETRRKRLTVSFDNNQIKDSSTSDLGGTAIRIMKNGKIGFSSSSKPDDDRVVDFALSLANNGKNAQFQFSPKTELKAFELDFKNFNTVDENKAIQDCERTVNEIRSLQDGLLAKSSLFKDHGSTRILTSSGLDFSQEFIQFSWYCGFEYNTEGNFLQIFEFKTEDEYTGFEKMVQKVRDDYEVCQKNETIKTGNYRVLFSPKSFMYLMNVFQSCLNGFSVVKRISPWGDKIGEKLFDERITLYSDMLSENSSHRRAVDDEGTPAGIVTFFDKGVLQSFYHSRDTAVQCGQEPTGHAGRVRFDTQPLPSMNGLVLKSGDDNIDNMKSDAQIWIDDLMGAVMSNPYSGIINGNISMGYTMENGKRRARIKDAMLSINVFEAFKNKIVAISKDSERIGFAAFFKPYDAPWLLIDGISISS